MFHIATVNQTEQLRRDLCSHADPLDRGRREEMLGMTSGVEKNLKTKPLMKRRERKSTRYRRK